MLTGCQTRSELILLPSLLIPHGHSNYYPQFIVFMSGTNRELEEMSKGENIVKWIKGQRISWLGYPERMEEERMSKKILEGTT